MKKQSILAALALLSTTLGTQAFAKSAKVADVFTPLAQPVSRVDVDLDKRRSSLEALAYIPAETDGFIAFADFGKHISRVMSGGMLLDKPVGPVPPELAVLKSLAVSMGEGTAGSLSLLLPMLSTLSQQHDGGMQGWVDVARPDLAQKIKTAVEQFVHEQTKKNTEEFSKNWQVKPVYAVVSLEKNKQKQVEQWAKMIVPLLLATNAEQAEHVKHGAFQGVKIKGVSFAPGQARDIYIMVKPVDSSLVFVVCANPQDVREPASIEHSALASPSLAVCDGCLDDLLMVGHSSQSLVRAVEEENRRGMAQTAETVCRVFEALGAADASQKAGFDKASAGVKTLLAQVLTACGSLKNQDSTWLCRLNKKNLILEYSGDAKDAEYAPGVLRYVSQMNEPGNILYAESTPLVAKNPAPNWESVLSAMLDVARGYTLTLPEEVQKNDEKTLGVLESLMPEFRMLGQAFSTMGSGLDRGGAVLLDSAAGLPRLFGGANNNKVAMPRFAYCSAVTQREHLTRAWDEMMMAAECAADKLLGSRMLVKALTFPAKKVGNAVSYSLYMPVCSENMIPNVTVSDSVFVAGSSSAYNEKLATAASGNMPFQGTVFSLNFERLATTLRGIADTYRSRIPVVEEAVPMASLDDEELSTAVSNYDAGKPSKIEEISETLEELAVAAELTADVAERMYGAITISGGRCTLRTVVDLQQK